MKFIKTNAPSAITAVTIESLNGKKIAIDMSLAIYQWCSVGQKRKIVNSAGKLINHIQGAFYRLSKMIAVGIIPVCVFDGPPPMMKSGTITLRKVARSSGGVRVPREVYVEVIKLCNLLGATVIISPSEAEAQCAYMAKTGLVDAVATDDTDSIAFGSPITLRGLDSNNSLTAVNYLTLLDELQLTSEQFTDLCILFGCDYTGTIPGIGPTRAYKLIKKYHTIDAVITGEKLNTTINYTDARTLLTNPLVSETIIMSKKLSADDIKTLHHYLVNIHGLLPSRIDMTLKKLASA